MHKEGYYSSGEFAAKAGITVRTVRFYDKTGILRPSFVTEKGARFYTDADFARLAQILLLKYLGFSLDEIRQLTVAETDYRYLRNSLRLQQRLVDDRIEQLTLVRKAIDDTATLLEDHESIDWGRMLDLIHLTGMENSLALQYQNANNLSARIRLHTLYSVNTEGWFRWLYRMCAVTEGMRILEIGCGNGKLWTDNMDSLPEDADITLSDISDGMIRDIRRQLGGKGPFSFRCFDAAQIPFPDDSFDLVIANHVLFYCQDPDEVCREVKRVLRKEGRFVTSTYGSRHMSEITKLVQEFDSRIVLSANRLYEQFGLENGEEILSGSFSRIRKILYPDALLVDHPEPLIEYILSCHGNQNQYLLDRYQDFRQFIQRKTARGFRITKEAGIFIASP